MALICDREQVDGENVTTGGGNAVRLALLGFYGFVGNRCLDCIRHSLAMAGGRSQLLILPAWMWMVGEWRCGVVVWCGALVHSEN